MYLTNKYKPFFFFFFSFCILNKFIRIEKSNSFLAKKDYLIGIFIKGY